MVEARSVTQNRRGRRTRERILLIATEILAAGGSDALSASAVARTAGVTWGTVQHQFGTADEMWSQVLRYVGEHQTHPVDLSFLATTTIEARVQGLLKLLWDAYDMPASRAVSNLRAALPQDAAQRHEAFPQTSATLEEWDRAWHRAYGRAFTGLDTDQARLAEVRALIPGVVQGLHLGAAHSTPTDLEAARRGLAGALTLYLARTTEI